MIKLIALINDNNEVIESNGYANIGVGIFDESGKEYPAGIKKNGIIIGSALDFDNTVLALDGITRLSVIHGNKI